MYVKVYGSVDPTIIYFGFIFLILILLFFYAFYFVELFPNIKTI
jgi:hypothetical protein